jgi:hypothetical protein
MPGALASLRPQFGLPPVVRRPLMVAIPALVAVWSLGGFCASLGPDLVRQVVGSSSPVLGGAALFVLAGFSALTVLVLRATPPRTVMFLGTVGLIAGVGITLAAVALTSGVVFFIGTAVGGVGFGAGFQSAIRTVLPLAAPHERSGVLSTLWVVSYLALGLPAIVAGYLVVHGGGFLRTTWEYGIAVIVLAALALAGLAGRARARTAGDRRRSVAGGEHHAEAGLSGQHLVEGCSGRLERNFLDPRSDTALGGEAKRVLGVEGRPRCVPVDPLGPTQDLEAGDR